MNSDGCWKIPIALIELISSKNTKCRSHFRPPREPQRTQRPQMQADELLGGLIGQPPPSCWKRIAVINITTDVHVLGRADSNQFVMDEKSTVSPNGIYPAFVPIILTGGEVDIYILRGVALSILVKVTYEDAMGKRNDQSFPMLFECNVNGFMNMEYRGKTPTEQCNYS